MIMSALVLSMTACGNNSADDDDDDDDDDGKKVTFEMDKIPFEKDDGSEEEKTTATTTVTEENEPTDDDENSDDEDKIGPTGPSDSPLPPEDDEDEKTEEQPNIQSNTIPDGPVKPTKRTQYTVYSSDYEDFLDGYLTLDELCAKSESYNGKFEDTIEYTSDGYIVKTRLDYPDYGMSMDFVSTFNNRGELVHQKETTFDSSNPDGAVTFDGSFVQQHFKEGTVQGNPYTSEMEVTSDGKIKSFNITQQEVTANHECVASSDWAIVHQNDCTIFYNDTTCEVYNTETRQNTTVLERGYFEAIFYNENGKIESIYRYNNTWDDGVDTNGNSHTDIREYVDYAIENDFGLYSAEWTYDKNGNVLSVRNTMKNTYTFYLYE